MRGADLIAPRGHGPSAPAAAGHEAVARRLPAAAVPWDAHFRPRTSVSAARRTAARAAVLETTAWLAPTPAGSLKNVNPCRRTGTARSV